MGNLALELLVHIRLFSYDINKGSISNLLSQVLAQKNLARELVVQILLFS